MSRANKLSARFVKIDRLPIKDMLNMHQLFTQYYHNSPLETFLKDLGKKEGVILIRERDTREVKGFTTIVKLPLKQGNRKAFGIFSGDTVVAKEYWGTTALHSGFMRYLLKAKFTNPRIPLYWLLISKGYKTYLLMANNVVNYYPRYDAPEELLLKDLVHQYCKKLFPAQFDAKSVILDFGTGYQKLKGDVAPIDDTMRKQFPKIAYFEKMNPTWQQGTELPCIGEIDFATIWGHMGKIMRRKIKARPPKEKRTTPALAVPRKALNYKFER